MSTSISIRLGVEPLRSLGFASIGASYMGVGSALENPARMVEVNNLTDADLFLSLDGVDDHFIIAAKTAKIYDITANKTREDGFFMEKGDRLYVRESETPTEKAIYFSVIHGESE